MIIVTNYIQMAIRQLFAIDWYTWLKLQSYLENATKRHQSESIEKCSKVREWKNADERKLTSKFAGKILQISSLHARSKSLFGITYSTNGLLLSASANRTEQKNNLVVDVNSKSARHHYTHHHLVCPKQSGC